MCSTLRIAGHRIAKAGNHHRRGYRPARVLDPAVPAGYRELQSRVVIQGDGTEEQFQKIHEIVMATSPNFFNITRAIRVVPELIVE
jgi:hypothetical protein